MIEKRPDRTSGSNQDAFWGWCAKGELRLPRCKHCGHITWPVLTKCENCGEREFAWEAMSGRGKVIGWTTFEQDYYRGLLSVPYDTILVELAEGPLFLSNPKGFGWRSIIRDMPVKLAFIEAEDANGAFSLPVFERG